MRTPARICAVGVALAALTGCVTTTAAPGTPDFAAAQVSRGYDCGLRVDRNRIIAALGPSERARFLAASRSLAVKSYRAPRACDAWERAVVQQELARLTRPARTAASMHNE